MKQSMSAGYQANTTLKPAALFIAMAALLTGAAPAPAAPPQASESVIIANVRYPGTCPVIAAQAKGYFASEGVAVTAPSYGSGKEALDAVFRGQAQFAVSGDIPVMFAVVDGRPVSIVAALGTVENDLGVMAKKDAGIAVPADLKGKRIGVTLLSGAHYFIYALLTQQKISARDVTIVDLLPHALSAALADGEIDAAVTWQPYLNSLKVQLGKNGTLFPSGGLYDATVLLSGSQNHVVTNRATREKVVRALISGAHFCTNSPDAARSLVAEAMKPDSPDLEQFWRTARFRISLDQSLLLALESTARWAIKNKLTARTEMPNYLKRIDLDALVAVAPASVTIVR